MKRRTAGRRKSEQRRRKASPAPPLYLSLTPELPRRGGGEAGGVWDWGFGMSLDA